MKAKFKYLSGGIDVILNRLPTAKDINEENRVYTVSAETVSKEMGI